MLLYRIGKADTGADGAHVDNNQANKPIDVMVRVDRVDTRSCRSLAMDGLMEEVELNEVEMGIG